MDRTDPYLVVLRRELTRAQARLRRCERERDALRAALAAQEARGRRKKPAQQPRNSKQKS